MKSCAHCNQLSMSEFCCSGCKVAYSLIYSLNLEEHYKYCREVFGTTPNKVELFVNEIDYIQFINTKNMENTIHLSVEGIKCGSCVWIIEGSLRKQNGVVKASVNMTTNILSITWIGEKERINEFILLVEQLGYKALPLLEETITNSQRNAKNNMLKAIAIAGFIWVQNMMISMGIWAGNISEEIGEHSRFFMNICAAVITVPGIIYAGQTFFKSAWSSIKAGKSHMDVPISIATIIILLMSVYGTFMNSVFVYYEAVSSLVFALLVGRYLDLRIREKASQYAKNLVLQRAYFVTLCSGDEMKITGIKNAKIGDTIYISSGERVPLDGTVIWGESQIDNSIITGETTPLNVENGSKIFAGAINVGAPIKMRVDSDSDNTVLSEIRNLIEKAENSKSKYITLSDKFARAYTPIVLILSFITTVVWIGKIATSQAILYGVSVLVITCPCALGLAVPIVNTVAISGLMKRGIFIRSADALERLSEITAAVFDKTGVLTYGKPKLLNADELPEWVIPILKGIAIHSKHHLCRSIVENFPEYQCAEIENVHEESGIGVSGTYNGEKIVIGRRKDIVSEKKENILSTWFCVDDTLKIELKFSDKIREEAAELVNELKKMHLNNITIMSGDKEDNVIYIAEICNINKYYAELTPQEKYEKISHMEKVMMVGDGLNDAAAMKAAHVSLSPSGIMELSQNQADIVFQGSLLNIKHCIVAAKKSQKVAKDNIIIAITYNIISIPLAMMGYATPLIAAIFMGISSIFVVLHTLLRVR